MRHWNGKISFIFFSCFVGVNSEHYRTSLSWTFTTTANIGHLNFFTTLTDPSQEFQPDRSDPR